MSEPPEQQQQQPSPSEPRHDAGDSGAVSGNGADKSALAALFDTLGKDAGSFLLTGFDNDLCGVWAGDSMYQIRGHPVTAVGVVLSPKQKTSGVPGTA